MNVPFLNYSLQLNTVIATLKVLKSNVFQRNSVTNSQKRNPAKFLSAVARLRVTHKNGRSGSIGLRRFATLAYNDHNGGEQNYCEERKPSCKQTKRIGFFLRLAWHCVERVRQRMLAQYTNRIMNLKKF